MARVVKQKVTFTLLEPKATSVQLAGDFSEWEKQPVLLKRDKDGWWTATVPLTPGAHQYRFLVDGQWRDDPACQKRVPNQFGAMNCVREVTPPPKAFRLRWPL